MNIREELLQEKVHTKAHATEITSYACSSPSHFNELMDCFLSNDYRIAQRAAWSVSWAARARPDLIKPYIKQLVGLLTRTDVHNAVIRNSVRVLELTDIPEGCHADVMNACFAFIEKPTTPAAIKAFSLTTLYNLSRHYPEIKQELKLIIETLWDGETPAFKSRGRKILKGMG
jgi:hypothetical protein